MIAKHGPSLHLLYHTLLICAQIQMIPVGEACYKCRPLSCNRLAKSRSSWSHTLVASVAMYACRLLCHFWRRASSNCAGDPYLNVCMLMHLAVLLNTHTCVHQPRTFRYVFTLLLCLASLHTLMCKPCVEFGIFACQTFYFFWNTSSHCFLFLHIQINVCAKIIQDVSFGL